MADVSLTPPGDPVGVVGATTRPAWGTRYYARRAAPARGGVDRTDGLAPVARDSALGALRAQYVATRSRATTRKAGEPTGRAVTAKGALGEETLRTKVAMMAAAQLSVESIGRGLLMSRDRVKAILGQVETTGMVEDFRRLVRTQALSESLDITVKGMQWVHDTIDAREPKAFDLVTRGLSNMEKVWSSAAGEQTAKGVQVAVINQPPAESGHAAEIAALVELLTAPPARP